MNSLLIVCIQTPLCSFLEISPYFRQELNKCSCSHSVNSIKYSSPSSLNTKCATKSPYRRQQEKGICVATSVRYVKMVHICLKSSLRVLNCIMGLGGIAITVYGILIIRVWQPEKEQGSSSHHLFVPWFFHAFLGAGIASCAICCLGDFAANTANSFCLSCYIMIVLLLLVLETVIMAHVFLNPNWEKELPKDLTERLDEFKDFVESSDDIWKWAAWLIFLIQGHCVLLATVLRTQKTNGVDMHESDDERLPLIDESNEHALVSAAIV